ncbi:MAG TPA: NADH-quinone oxidoreductase subunit C [Xanthomonadaceae bacterium]|nr:NADH-quinone oxidoreductase subunit C [Xanthomonadaceae bacterium]
MISLSEFVAAAPLDSQKPWPRALASVETWRAAAARLARGDWELLGLWGESEGVHMAVREPASGTAAVLSLACAEHFPSVAQLHPPAQRLERAIKDLCGLEASGAPDARPWLDHGRWPLASPLGRAHARTPAALDYAFLATEGEDIHRIPVGPVHAGIIEPGHFRFSAFGETVVRLEQRLGYVHKGTETLLANAEIPGAAMLAGRVSGDSTVAYALAFARALEAATGTEVPPRAHWLRALLAELERVANHFGDWGAICNDASFALLHAHCGVWREHVLRAADACFGHRLMMDRVVPGGVACDLDDAGEAMLRLLMAQVGAALPSLIDTYENTASLQDRTVGTGFVHPDLARQFGAGGFVGRASGRDFDARRDLAYPPYDQLEFQVPVFQQGDVDARVWMRIREIEQSIGLVKQILDGMPGGDPAPSALTAVAAATEGIAVVEGFRGDILVWLRLDASGRIRRCHLRDPSWFQWPLLEAAIEGNIVADFPLCNKSFNCSYSGHDL